MKIKQLLTAALIACASIAWGLSPEPGAGPRGKILVLGFESRQLNDIQDRLLRETIMRELLKKKFRTATVIEVEGLITEGGGVNLRKAGKADLNRLCRETLPKIA